MARLTIKEAVTIAQVSESTLRRDIKSGKVSSEKDDRGRRRIDTAELVRVYGMLTHLTPSNDSEMNTVDTPRDAPKIIALLETQVDDLKAQLESANAEKKELLELANRLQKQNEVLMLPSEAGEKRNWLLRLVGVR